MVEQGRGAAMSEAWRILGTPRAGGILVVSDHASNLVPDDIELGIAPELLDQHVAIDIGVTEVGELMAQQPGFAAFQGNVICHVCDFNRAEHLTETLPHACAGLAHPGTAINHSGTKARL